MSAAPASPSRAAVDVRSPRAGWAARWLTLIARWLRVSAFVSVALVIVLLFNLHQARGQVGEQLLSMGRELGPLRDLLHGTQSARINGENMFLASTVSEQPLTEVLNRFEQHCLERTGGLRESFASLPDAAREQVSRKAPAAWRFRHGILREEKDTEGMVVCVARSGQAGLKAWVMDLRRFLSDGELSHLGELRYVYAQRTETGRTHVLSTFTRGAFNLYRAIGQREPASDARLEAVPLPPHVQRPMTFSVDGMPYAAQLFQVPGKPEDVTSYYLETLPRLGWTRVMGPGELYSSTVFSRQGKTLTLAAFELDDSGKSNVTLTEGSASP
jgi:hypothetical protein